MLSENQMNLSDSCSSSSYSSRSNNSSRLSSPNFHFTAHRMTQIGVIRSNFQMKLEATTNDDGMGCRSPLQQYPGGSSPPTYSSHGTRTVREFEEQMSNLRKENFNLKLRLYFIEETIPSYHPRQQHNQNHQQGNEGGSSVDSCGHENILKQLIDTKVEREVLRKELQEKQEILKEAAQAMTQMENIQKDTETRYDEMIEELQHKIQQLEMDRDKDNAMNPTKLNSAVMSDIMGHSDISGNGTSINAIQKIRELEGLLKQSEIKLVELQSENIKLEDTLNKRNETISEYEEKVKELVFKNSELLETIESKDKEIVTAERSMRNIRLTNDDLKVDNENLIAALRETQEKFQKEVTNSQTFEHQVREQQDTLNRMQSTITIKTANAARLLERIQEYERMVTRINIERNIFKRENRFFRTIIDKLEAVSALPSTTPTSTLKPIPASTSRSIPAFASPLTLRPKQRSKDLNKAAYDMQDIYQQQNNHHHKQQQQQMTSNRTIKTNANNCITNNSINNSDTNINANTSNSNTIKNTCHWHRKFGYNYNNYDRGEHFYYKLFNEFVERGRLSKRCKCCRGCCRSKLTSVKSFAASSSGTSTGMVLESDAGKRKASAIIDDTEPIDRKYKCKQKLSLNFARVSAAAAATATASATSAAAASASASPSVSVSASTSGTVATAAITSATAIGSFHCLRAARTTTVNDGRFNNDYHLSTRTSHILDDYLQTSTNHLTKCDELYNNPNKNATNLTQKMLISDGSDDDLNIPLRASMASSPITTKELSTQYSINGSRLLNSLHKTSSSSFIRKSKSFSTTSLISTNSSISTDSYLRGLPDANDSDTKMSI